MNCEEHCWPDVSIPSPVAAIVCGCAFRSADPLDLVRLPFQGSCKFVLVTPKFEAPTREMRAALPAEVPFKSMISNNIAGGTLVRFKSYACNVT